MQIKQQYSFLYQFRSCEPRNYIECKALVSCCLMSSISCPTECRFAKRRFYNLGTGKLNNLYQFKNCVQTGYISYLGFNITVPNQTLRFSRSVYTAYYLFLYPSSSKNLSKNFIPNDAFLSLTSFQRQSFSWVPSSPILT